MHQILTFFLGQLYVETRGRALKWNDFTIYPPNGPDGWKAFGDFMDTLHPAQRRHILKMTLWENCLACDSCDFVGKLALSDLSQYCAANPHVDMVVRLIAFGCGTDISVWISMG